MANLLVKNGDGEQVYLEYTGTGTDLDPFISSIGKSKESTVNSTTTLLTNGSTFTGTGELTNDPDVMINVKTDQNGIFYADFSTDGTNWDSTLLFIYDTARINAPHILVKGYRYFRIRFYNNSGFDQTYLRLQCDFGAFAKLTSPVNGTISENYDALVVRPTNYHYEVAMGKRQGRTTWNKFGYNIDVDTASTETIWSVGGNHTILTTASTLTVVSTDANDITSTGTGAQSIVVYGVDANNLSQIEVVQMNGTTNVVTASTWLGINRVSIYLSGSGTVNAGTINITATTGGTTQAQIPIGEGTSQQAIFFTQGNHTALLDFLFLNINKIAGAGGNPVVTIKAWVYSRVSNSKYEVFRDTIDTAVENHLVLTPSQPFVIGEKSVLWFTATTDVNNTVVGARFSLIEERIL